LAAPRTCKIRRRDEDRDKPREILMRITWLSHSCFELVESMNILVDPYIRDNPMAPRSVDEFDPDLIAVTHGHADHLGNAEDIARRTGSPVLAVAEVARYLDRQGVRSEGMNIGGSFQVADVLFTMTRAIHSSDITATNPPTCGGEAAGFVIDDGIRVYHAGDTALFSDMRLIGDLYRPDVALLPIGGRYTMGPREAAIATSWIRPHLVIPMHYNTWPRIKQDPAEFQDLVETLCDSEVVIVEAGDAVEC
jgi:L-ascorbate metabolism protein UlaG (beta-lactamase superfamily)